MFHGTLMTPRSCREWPTDADQYELMEECGRGVSATVCWTALCCVLMHKERVGARACSRTATIRIISVPAARTCCGSQVWRARCKVTGEIVAIKVMDLENVNCSLVRDGRPLAASSGQTDTSHLMSERRTAYAHVSVCRRFGFVRLVSLSFSQTIVGCGLRGWRSTLT